MPSKHLRDTASSPAAASAPAAQKEGRRQRGGGAATRVQLLLLLLLFRPAGTAAGRSHQGGPLPIPLLLPHHGPVRVSEGRVKAWASQRYGTAWHSHRETMDGRDCIICCDVDVVVVGTCLLAEDQDLGVLKRVFSGP